MSERSRCLNVDIDRWGDGARARFFELVRSGDDATLRRFVTGLAAVDIDRNQPVRVRFEATLPELIQPWGDDQN